MRCEPELLPASAQKNQTFAQVSIAALSLRLATLVFPISLAASRLILATVTEQLHTLIQRTAAAPERAESHWYCGNISSGLAWRRVYGVPQRGLPVATLLGAAQFA
jgi:hypothetical protein